MKLAVLTCGMLPIPAVQGGAVENLIDFYLEYNDKHRLHDITVYSVWHPDVNNHPALKSEVNHYIYIKVNSWWNKLKKNIYKKTHVKEYYHYTIEYYLHEAIKDIRKQKYDVILLENRPGYAVKLKKVTDAQLVYHLHNEKLSTQIPQYQTIYDAASCIITVSNYIKGLVQTVNPGDSKTKTLYNGIDMSAFTSSTPTKPRSSLRLSDDNFVLLFSGRITKEKGIMELIQAISTLKGIPNWKLLIVGASAYGRDEHPTPFIEELIKVAEPIKDRIIFTGFVDYKQIPSYLKMADIAVVPSMWEEPFGLTVVEAMAAGLPLITTRSGGIPEICEGVATIVEREHIVNNLAAAILDLYQHPEKRKQMATASLERSRLFDKETYARNFFQALEHID